jgi:hypothetical protein
LHDVDVDDDDAADDDAADDDKKKLFLFPIIVCFPL